MAAISPHSSFNLSFFDMTMAKANFSKFVQYVIGYGRLSFDEDGNGYCSIINQRDIIQDLYWSKYQTTNSEFTFIEDDGYSGYKFDRPGLMHIMHLIEQGKCNIIITKDLSRLGRHGALTQLFIEQCERVGVKIVAMDDYHSDRKSDDLILGIRAWNNERAVKEASEKVIKVIRHKQKNGTWVCAASYGLKIINYETGEIDIDEEPAKTIMRIGLMYLNNQGINKIAKTLTSEGVMTPSIYERQKAIENGKTYKKHVSTKWTASRIAKILDDPSYSGVLVTGKYKRDGINGKDVLLPPEEWNYFPNHHPAIWDEEMYAAIKAKRQKRKTDVYRVGKRNESLFHGLLICGKCGHKLYHYVNASQRVKPAYICSQHFKYGKSACCRNPIKDSVLIDMTIALLQHMVDVCPDLIKSLDYMVGTANTLGEQKQDSIKSYIAKIAELEKELEVIEEQRIKQIIAHPERETTLNTIYDKLHDDAQKNIDKHREMVNSLQDKDNTFQEAVRKIKTAKDAIQQVIETKSITRNDIEALFKEIVVYPDGAVDIKLAYNLENAGMPQTNIHDQIPHCSDQNARDFTIQGKPAVNVVREGDPSRTTFTAILAIASGLDRLAKQFVKNRLVQN